MAKFDKLKELLGQSQDPNEFQLIPQEETPFQDGSTMTADDLKEDFYNRKKENKYNLPEVDPLIGSLKLVSSIAKSPVAINTLKNIANKAKKVDLEELFANKKLEDISKMTRGRPIAPEQTSFTRDILPPKLPQTAGKSLEELKKLQESYPYFSEQSKVLQQAINRLQNEIK